jgi:hypothetical protein
VLGRGADVRRSAEDEADRAKKKEAKEAKRAEKRAALQAEYEAHQAKKKEAKEAKTAARAETLAGSRFASTPCYNSLWTYAVVFPDRVEERKKDDSIAKVRFLRDVAGVERTMAGVQLTGAGWSDTFICKGQEEEKQMIAVITSLLSGSGSPARDDD